MTNHPLVMIHVYRKLSWEMTMIFNWYTTSYKKFIYNTLNTNF